MTYLQRLHSLNKDTIFNPYFRGRDKRGLLKLLWINIRLARWLS